jgi:hypothetical protein
MGFFSFLFRETAKHAFLEDTVFGPLEQKSFGKDNAARYYHTYDLVFAPTGHKIECEIRCSGDVSLNGPTAAQRLFYQHIERSYAQLEGALMEILQAELKDWNPPFRFHHFAEEFRLVYLEIPVIASTSVEWEWTFELVRDGMYSLRIAMQGDIPCPGVGISY